MTDDVTSTGGGALEPEDEARADLYALLARLYYAPPDTALLSMIAGAPEIGADAEDPAFAKAWAALAAAAATADPAAVAREYDALLVGTGRTPVTPYFTHYLTEAGREQMLADLRGVLARLRLARTASAKEPEDHVAGLCDAMRHLVSAGSGTLSLARQREFFTRWIGPGFPAFCSALRAEPQARFYAAVAGVTEAFLSVENEGFSML
jgi:TorA maturation chaperone TorD